MSFWDWVSAWSRDPLFWAWFTAWSRDDAVWDWIRTATAAVAGAFLGGFFTLRGQRRAESAQRAAQRLEFEESRDAATVQWDRERATGAWDRSLTNAGELFERFTALHRTIRATPITKRQAVDGLPWENWDQIWDEEISLDLDVRSRLLADDATRLGVQRIVDLMDRSDKLTAGYNLERLDISHKQLVEQLSGEAIEVIGSYIRLSPLNEGHKELVATLEKAWDAYVAYEEWDLQRSIEFAERLGAEENSTQEEQLEAAEQAGERLAERMDRGEEPLPER